MPTFVEGSAVLIEDGLRFDLARVLDACEAVIETCAGAFGPPVLATAHAHHARLAWPDPGRKAFRNTWIGAGKVYDAVCEPLIAVYDPLCLKIFPLGMTWCEHHEDTGEITTPSGGPISGLDPTPRIEICGQERGADFFEPASATLVEIVECLMMGPLIGLGLRKAPLAMILLPHAVYGAGRGPIRVRCRPADSDVLS
jgi:hypothetical protein